MSNALSTRSARIFSLGLLCVLLALLAIPKFMPAQPNPDESPAAQPDSQPATLPTAQSVAKTQVDWPDEIFGGFVSLLVLGAVLLAIWIIRRILHPEKLSLRGAPNRLNVLTVVHLLGVFLGYQGIGVGLYLLLQEGLGYDKSPALLLGGIASNLIVIPLFVLLAHRWFALGARRGLGLCGRHWVFDTLRAILGFLMVLPVSIALVYLGTYLLSLLPGGEPKPHLLLDLLYQDHSLPMILAVYASAVVLAPLSEEIFFRGFLQSMLRNFALSPRITVLIAAAIFAMLHSEPQNIPALFVLGLVLGYCYERTGRLWAPILLHALFNAFFVTVQLLQLHFTVN